MLIILSSVHFHRIGEHMKISRITLGYGAAILLLTIGLLLTALVAQNDLRKTSNTHEVQLERVLFSKTDTVTGSRGDYCTDGVANGFDRDSRSYPCEYFTQEETQATSRQHVRQGLIWTLGTLVTVFLSLFSGALITSREMPETD